MTQGKAFVTAAVVVNWNGWRDTIACVESLLALDGPAMRVVICDNGSTDASVPELERWLQQRRPPACQDPVEENRAGPGTAEGVLSVHLLALGRNLGYAGGINAGIDWAQAKWSPDAFWLLNNDVEAQPGALQALITAQQQTPAAGICGSVLLDWEDPRRIQAVGGLYRRWLGVGWHDTTLPGVGTQVSSALDYPVGASLFVTAGYLRDVGPMDPSYFLYYEEMDWAERGRRLGYRPIVALSSRLRHKEGASTGSHGGVRHKSLLSERHGVINRLRITRKFWPAYLPLVWLSLLLVVADRSLHREWARAFLVLRLMASPGQWGR